MALWLCPMMVLIFNFYGKEELLELDEKSGLDEYY